VPPTMSGRRRAMLSGSLSAHRRRFLATESGGAALLVVATVLALLWANSPWSDAYTRLFATEIGVQVGSRAVSMDLGHWINDGLMAVFFLVVGLEVRRDLSVGELTDRSRLVLPIIGGLGGLIVPALIYLAINPSGEAARGWGVVIGTDTAFLLGVLALVGPSVSSQLRVFLLTLTVVDDIVAVSVIGIVYSRSLSVPALLVAGAAVLLLAEFSRARVWQTWPYVVVIVVLWLATVASGLHASVAGMLAGLLVPAFTPPRDAVDSASRYLHAFRQSPMAQVGRSASQALRQAVSVNERMQLLLHPWSGYVIVPVFALANAGVDLRGGLLAESLRSPVVWGIVAGLVLGKLVGIGGSALVAARLGAGRLPQGVGPGQVLGGAALSGIGFTVSLLIAHLAFGPELREQATVGVLISLVLATGLGWLVFGLAARFLGETSAGLPMILADPVDPERDHILGPVDAPLTLVEYADYECPFCAQVTGVIEEVRAYFGDDLRYVWRHLPLPDVHPHAELAGAAAEAAAAQGRYWEMSELLYTHQDELEPADLTGYAAELGLDVERFIRDLEEGIYTERVRRDAEGAEASGARGTPTFFIGTRRHVGPYDARSLIAALEASRART